MRATYLFIVVGVGLLIWPSLLNPLGQTEHMRGVVRSMVIPWANVLNRYVR